MGATRWAAKNHVRSGRCVLCMIVPAVTDVWRPQVAHSHVHGLASSFQPRFEAQQGQVNPSGQRCFASQSAQVASSGKSAMKRGTVVFPAGDLMVARRHSGTLRSPAPGVESIHQIWCLPELRG